MEIMAALAEFLKQRGFSISKHINPKQHSLVVRRRNYDGSVWIRLQQNFILHYHKNGRRRRSLTIEPENPESIAIIQQFLKSTFRKYGKKKK